MQFFPSGSTRPEKVQLADGRIKVLKFDNSEGHLLTEVLANPDLLAKVRGRLTALYGTAARFTLAPNIPRGIRATIEVPALPAIPQAAFPLFR